MDATLPHPLPRRGAVLRAQLRAVGLSLRREALLVAGGLGALSAWLVAIRAIGDVHLVPGAMPPAVAAALFAALAVWKGEDPARRGYHWSMPVGHADHAMAKALAGWVWLVAAIGAYMAWLGVMAAALRGDVGVEWRWEADVQVAEVVAAWRWLVPFAGATVLYLLGTALALRSRHPWRWLAGGVVGYVFLGAWSAALDGAGTPLHSLVDTLWGGRYGLRTAVTGMAPDSYSFSRVHGLFYSGPSYLRPSFVAWIAAAPLWLAVSLGVAVLAARRQPRGG